MSTYATVVDGQITNQVTAQQKAEEKKAVSNDLDKDAFLQLLVAQMKYQDPLEPTSNTEYISQLASFSSLEEMQNMGTTMDMSRASSLVGQYVFIKSTDSSGNTTYPEGVVDYVVYQGGKTFLSVNDILYNLEDLDTVADPEYLLATRLRDTFVNELNKLPKVENVTKSDLANIKKLTDVYNNMSAYQKTFIKGDVLDAYKSYVKKYEELGGNEKES